MQSTTIRHRFIKLFALVALGLIVFGFIAPTGLDSYEIYLNKQLLLKQNVNQPLSLRKLQLAKAKEHDQLRIQYRHCQSPYTGTDRAILIKDQKGNVLKRWSFPNNSGDGMVIAVKELQQLEKKAPSEDLRMHYLSRELPKEQPLAFIQFK